MLLKEFFDLQAFADCDGARLCGQNLCRRASTYLLKSMLCHNPLCKDDVRKTLYSVTGIFTLQCFFLELIAALHYILFAGNIFQLPASEARYEPNGHIRTRRISKKPRMRLGHMARSPSRRAFSQASRKLLLVGFGRKGVDLDGGGSTVRQERYLNNYSWFCLRSLE